MRIALFGDGTWAARSAVRLVEEGHALACVVLRARPSDPTLARIAATLGVPALQPADPNAEAFVATLAGIAPELGLSIAYDRILRRPLLDVPRRGFVNFHAGKLPAYRGRNVINWALINGETEIGLTAHCVDEGIDSGPILLQRTLPIGWTDTYGDVLGRVVDAMPALVAQTVSGIAAGELSPRPQPPGQGTYFGGRLEGDEWLDWRATSRDLHNKIRGITRPGPGARTLLGDRSVTIWRAFYDPRWPSYRATPGEVVGRGPEGVYVKTGDSTLLVQEVEIEDGDSEIPRWRIGTRLGIDPAACLPRLLARVRRLEEEVRQRREHHAVP